MKLNDNLPPGVTSKDISKPDRCERCGDIVEDAVIIDGGDKPDTYLCPDCALDLD